MSLVFWTSTWVYNTHVSSSSMIVIVFLKKRCLISGSSAYSIAARHDFLQLIEVLENVDAYASVEPCRFKQPQILLFMTALGNLKRCFDGLFLLLLTLLQFGVNNLIILLKVTVNEFEYIQECFYSIAYVVLKIIQYYSEWHYIINISFLSLIVTLHI